MLKLFRLVWGTEAPIWLNGDSLLKAGAGSYSGLLRPSTVA